MNDAAVDQLSRIVASEGKEIVHEPRRISALLSDRCAEYRLELNLLTAALEEGIPESLLTSAEGAPTVVTLERLARQLESGRGVEYEKARWAVHAWAAALDLRGGQDPQIDPRGLGVETQDKPPPGSRLKQSLEEGETLVGESVAPLPGSAPGEDPPRMAPRSGRFLGSRKSLALVGVVVGVGLVGVGLLGLRLLTKPSSAPEVFLSPGSPAPSSQSSTPSPTTSSPPLTAAEQALQRHIPARFSATCTHLDTSSEPGAIAGLGCDPQGPVAVGYFAFPSAQEASRAFDIHAQGLASGPCNPSANAAFSAVAPAINLANHQQIGRVGCYVTSAGPHMVWTTDALSIMGSAYETGPNDFPTKQSLFQFWQSAGPL